ncbi:MAG: hypothetical protein HYY18_17590 [Planctomycetes bacterium]|nr:hypothetical protein [Planctomycetota bacterium]
MRRFLILLLVLASPARAGDVETIHILPGSHLDIGFTDTPSAVREKRVRVLDDAIDTAEKDPGFHWHEESAWVVHQWRLAHRDDAARQDRLRALLKAGRISMGASWCNPHAAMFAEHLDLLFFHLDTFERELGVRPSVAVLNDVPSYPEALVDACARAKVRYLLVGANMAFTPPLPAGLARSPFWWESAAGNRVLVYIDDDAYTAAYTRWGVDPDCARFFNPETFPRDRGALETMEAGIGAMLKKVEAPGDAVIVQHAFDNWDTGGAKKLPGFVKQWNEAKTKPRLVLGGPEAYFRRVEEKFGKDLPVRRGEWGGQWDAIRAVNPAWTWRVREAMAALRPDAPFEAKAALATAMEHSQGLGPGWGGMFTEEQTRSHAREIADLFALAVGRELADANPPFAELPMCDLTCKETWRRYLGHVSGRLRAGRTWLAPFTFDQSPELKAEILYGFNSREYATRFTVDRAALKGSADGDVTVVFELPLNAEAKSLAIAPENSAAARAGSWLRGAPPAYVVAPAGLRVTGLEKPLRVTSPLVFSWCLVADKADPKITWLQGCVVRQSLRAELKDRTLKAMSLADLYPGEPAELGVVVRVEIVEE